jgi:hypothetical protein
MNKRMHRLFNGIHFAPIYYFRGETNYIIRNVHRAEMEEDERDVWPFLDTYLVFITFDARIRERWCTWHLRFATRWWWMHHQPCIHQSRV